MSTPMKLAVLGAGAVTSVGSSLPASSAAVHAGLNNFQDTQFEDELGEPIVGAALELGPGTSGTRKPQGHARRLFPAASTGHVDCAFGPLILALAWQLAKRKRLPGPKILIQLSSSHTLRGVIAAHAGAA